MCGSFYLMNMHVSFARQIKIGVVHILQGGLTFCLYDSVPPSKFCRHALTLSYTFQSSTVIWNLIK